MRACARAGVAHLPLQQGTRHSILTMLGQELPERVLRDFSRHRDARSLDRYSKPRATRGAIVRAFPGPRVVPGATSAAGAEANTAESPGRVAHGTGGAERDRTGALAVTPRDSSRCWAAGWGE